MAVDPLGALAAGPGVAEAAESARAAIDALLWRRDVRAAAAEVAAASVERGGRDSAAIDGADLAAPDDSPMGRLLGNALAVTAAVPGVLPAWRSAPLQALAALHTVASTGFADDAARGRPRGGDGAADDPLHLGFATDAEYATKRLASLGALLAAPTAAPAVVVAGVVHAELMVLQPFAWGSGLVARAAARCVLADRGVDPSLFSIPERGMLAQGRPAYVAAMRAYREGAPDALIWFARSCELGAEAVQV